MDRLIGGRTIRNPGWLGKDFDLNRFSKQISKKVATPCRASGQTVRFALPFGKFVLRNAQ